MFEHPAHGSMSAFVESDGPFFSRADDLASSFQPAHNTVDCIQKILLLDGCFVFSGGDQGSFVAYIGNVCPGKSRCLFGQEFQLKTFFQLQTFGMYLKNLQAFFHFGKIHMYLPVKPSCPHQGLVKNIGPVRCSQDDHTAIGAESIHLCKQLVQRVFAFIVRSESCILAPGTTYGIDFVNEHDTGSFFLCLPEQVPYP